LRPILSLFPASLLTLAWAGGGSALNLAPAASERPISALEALHRALYGPPAEIPLSDLLAAPADFEGRAVRTHGRFGPAPGRREGYGLAAASGAVRLQPEPALAARVRARAGTWQGKDVELTGVLFREAPRPAEAGKDVEPGFGIRFWSVTAPEAPQSGAEPEATLVTLEDLVYRGAALGGKPVRAVGKFRGQNLFGDLPILTRRNDTDWVIKDDFFAVWVTGKAAEGEGFRLDPHSPADAESWVEVLGRPETRSGVTYLRAQRVSLAEVSGAVAPAPIVGAKDYSDRPPAVVFTLPVAGEVLKGEAAIVLQFNKHMDEISFSGRVRVRYADTAAAMPKLRLLYEDTSRALVVDPGEPLAPGRELVLELLEGIVDIHGIPLASGGKAPAAGVIESIRYRIEG
jgi:hypothetical protein